MAVFTNVTNALINLHDGATPLIPGMATDVNDDLSNNPRFQELLAAGSIVAGDPPPVEPPPEGEVQVQTFYSEGSAPEGQDTVSGGGSKTSTTSGGASTVTGGATTTTGGATTTTGGTKA